MTLSQARQVFQYWDEWPPENELAALLARVYTTWKPRNNRITTEEEHRASLEERWKAGAMNAKQIFEAFGGAKGVAIRMDGTTESVSTGINDFPGVSSGQ